MNLPAIAADRLAILENPSRYAWAMTHTADASQRRYGLTNHWLRALDPKRATVDSCLSRTATEDGKRNLTCPPPLSR